jgi:hypothetical protein
MKRLRVFVTAVLAVLVLGLLNACSIGQAAATIGDIPAFPGATELKPGESKIGDTLANNMQQDQAMRQQLGVGGKVEQKGFSLPQDATWEAVKAFYDEKLKAAGWGTNSMVSGIMEQANQESPVKTANWQRGQQNVTVVMITLPTDETVKELVISLASQ